MQRKEAPAPPNHSASSSFILLQQHVGNPLPNWVAAGAIWAHQRALCDMNVHHQVMHGFEEGNVILGAGGGGFGQLRDAQRRRGGAQRGPVELWQQAGSELGGKVRGLLLDAALRNFNAEGKGAGVGGGGAVGSGDAGLDVANKEVVGEEAHLGIEEGGQKGRGQLWGEERE